MFALRRETTNGYNVAATNLSFSEPSSAYTPGHIRSELHTLFHVSTNEAQTRLKTMFPFAKMKTTCKNSVPFEHFQILTKYHKDTCIIVCPD